MPDYPFHNGSTEARERAMQEHADKDKTCSHCGRPQRGSAAIYLLGAEIPLCHPDEGLDCYHLVTVYGERLGDRRGAL